MSNPTSNFGWVMPTNTDLVTDLPADFAVFGQAVDTSMADLLGGTTGQILAKASGTNMDFTWIANDQGDITAVTTTAPLQGGGTSGALALTVDAASTSASGVVQLSNSTSTTSSVLAATPTAVKSAYDLATTANTAAGTAQTTADAAIAKSTLTTAGDVIYRNATVPTRLGIGTAGQVLTVNSGATAPQWSTPAGASGPTFQAQRASDQSIAAGTWVKLQLTQENWDTAGCYDNTTNFRFTPTTSGYYQVNMRMYMGIDTGGGQITAPNIYKNGAATNIYVWSNNTSGTTTSMSAASGQIYFNGSTDYIEMFGFCNTGTTRNVGAGTYMDAIWIRS